MTRRISILALLVPTMLAGCVGDTSKEPPIVPIRNMYNQPRYDSQSKAPFFEDGRTMRPQVEGTLPVEADPEIAHATGRTDDNTGWVLEIPAPIVERKGGMAALIERGQQRYGIYCAPCHNYNGDGRGMVVQRGFPQPVSFVDTQRLLDAPVGYYYNAITNGFGRMFSYASRVRPEDRWAISAYVKALQLSQNASVSDVPADVLSQLTQTEAAR